MTWITWFLLFCFVDQVMRKRPLFTFNALFIEKSIGDKHSAFGILQAYDYVLR